MKNTFLMCFLLVILILGPSWKIVRYSHKKMAVIDQVQSQLVLFMVRQGFPLSGKALPDIDIPFQILQFQSVANKTPLIIMPITASGEGAYFLASNTPPATTHIYFVYGGRLQSEFPFWSFLRDKITFGLRQSSGLSLWADESPPTVLALAYPDDCLPCRTINWTASIF